MRQIAIECSGVGGSVAVLSGNVVLASTILEEKPGTARTLAIAVQNLLHLHPGRPDFVSVTNGPGSFTGLRVGLATAKTLAYAWNVPVVPVNSLSVIAQQVYLHSGESFPIPSREACVVVLMNAFRKQLFAAAFQDRTDSDADPDQVQVDTDSARRLVEVAGTQIVDVAAWQRDSFLSLIWNFDPPDTSNVFVSGPGIISAGGAESLHVVPQSMWNPSAETLGRIAYSSFLRGETTTAIDLLPNYIRGSAAEENKKHSV